LIIRFTRKINLVRDILYAFKNIEVNPLCAAYRIPIKEKEQARGIFLF
jgi:hypothetical protein